MLKVTVFSTPPRLIASLGMPNTTQLSSSCATVCAPALRISSSPAAPSSPMPVMITPSALAPAHLATERNSTSTDGRCQTYFYLAQLRLARKHGLPVILHVRKSADQLLKGLRSVAGPAGAPWQGIAHAFNGSEQQAQAFLALGLKLGFGGALTFDRALQLRRLASKLPLNAIVLETDAPDMPPHWIYKTALQRANGEPQGRNEPAELPRIGAVLARLRGLSTEVIAAATTRNALDALPRLRALCPPEASNHAS